MNPIAQSPPRDALISQVREVFAQVTRYPLEILDPDSLLEEDLGVDSVKLGEVFSVLRERFDLPEKMDLEPEHLESITTISHSLAGFLGGTGNGAGSGVSNGNGAAPEAGVAAANGNGAAQANGNGNGNVSTPAVEAAPSAPAAGGAPADLEGEVRGIFAEVTRYPLDILAGDADLEEDLGVDSVKLGEVFSVLRERFDLPEKLDIPEDDLRTLGGITQALTQHLGGSAGAATEAQDPEPVAAPPAPSSQPTEFPALANGSQAHGGQIVGGQDAGSQPNGSPVNGDPVNGAVWPPVADLSFPDPAPPASRASAHLTPEAKPFEGKVAYVSGSGRGLGKDIACYLAELGATVVVNSFHSRQSGVETEQEIREAGGEAHHIWGSVAQPAQLDAIFDEIESTHGRLDFFISNASNGMLARLEDIKTEHWEKAFRTNVVGLHRSAMRAAKLMRAQGGGKIVTLSSPAAHGYVDYFGCMGAVKAAVESLTRSLAVELAKDNIQVNCVSPGPVYGELLKKWPDSERLVPQWEENTAYERLCEARDVSHFIAYLLSEPVKLFTGSVLIMDGGISCQGW